MGRSTLLSAGDKALLKNENPGAARTVAEASGGILGINKVSANEDKVLAHYRHWLTARPARELSEMPFTWVGRVARREVHEALVVLRALRRVAPGRAHAEQLCGSAPTRETPGYFQLLPCADRSRA